MIKTKPQQKLYKSNPNKNPPAPSPCYRLLLFFSITRLNETSNCNISSTNPNNVYSCL